MLKNICLVAAVLLLFLLPLYCKTLLAAKSQLEQARSFRAQGKIERSINAYRRAAAWDSPGNVYAAAAAGEFLVFAKSIVQPELKLEALRQLRSSLISSRSIFRPENNNDRSRLLLETEMMLQAIENSSQPRGSLQMAANYQPSFAWQIVAQLMFWCWIVSVVFLCFRCFDPEGRLLKPALVKGVVPIAAFYLLWLLALSQA